MRSIDSISGDQEDIGILGHPGLLDGIQAGNHRVASKGDQKCNEDKACHDRDE